MDQEQAPMLLSVADASRVMGLGRSLLYELIRSGNLKSIKVGRRRLIPAHAIEEWIVAQPSGASS